MKTIKFSHVYDKFPPDDDPSVLLEVFTVDVKDLSPEFLEYDTKIVDGGRYPLPRNGCFLVLLLYQASNKHLWTTIRRQTAEKEAYYRSMIGREFSMGYPGGSQ